MRKFLCMLAMIGAACNAAACPPCPKEISLADTLAKTDAVIVGERLTAMTDEEKTYRGGPEVMEIKVREVWKGTLTPGAVIKAKGWSQMCPYGIITPPREAHVMLLAESQPGLYNSVNANCAPKTFSYKDRKVVMQDKVVSADAFKKLLH